MSLTREERIHELMLNEISEKSLHGGLIFSAFSIFVYFYGFGLELYKTPLRIACAGVIVASVLRFMASRSSRENIFWFWMKLRSAVWLNAICWSAIFSMVALELNLLGIHSVIAIAIMTNFLTGSIVTLSGDRWLFFPFHFFLLTPLMVISVIRAQEDPINWIFAGAFLFMFVFIVGLSLEYRRLLQKRFSNQLELEDSYALLRDQTSQLVQTSKLAALGEMAGGMAHEINNPLTIIALLVKRIQSIVVKPAPDLPLVESLLTDIDGTVLRISRIIQALRNVSRSSDDEHSEARLGEIFEDVFGICSEKFGQSDVKLEFADLEKHHLLKISCQRVQISQVLINLLSNAFDAVKMNQESKWVKVSLNHNADNLWIRVSNSGPVIEEGVRKKLFQPFFTTKDVGQGTGLGLSISKKIIEAHNGEIFLEQDGAPHDVYRSTPTGS